MWSRIQTFLIVSLITVMIWTFAEAESLTTKTIRLELSFATDPQTGRFIVVPDGQGWNGRVEVNFEGSTASVGDLESSLRRGVVLRAGMEGVPSEAGEWALDLNQALRAVPEIDNRGVTVVKVDPPTVRIAIDTLVSRDVTIIADVPGVVVDGPVDCKPSKAKLTLPKSLADRIPQDATVTARVTSDAIGALIPGRSETVQGVLLLPPAALAGHTHVTIVPDRADVQLKLRSRNDSFTIATVPVHIKIAVGELGRWNVAVPEEDRFVRDVKVSGSIEEVDRIRRGEIRITAILPLSFDELERGITAKDVVFSEVPTELKFDADRVNVRLKITRRDPAAGANPGS